VKHCESIDLDVTPTGAIFRGPRWPEEIDVDRNLLDYLPGPHVSFGRFGILRFTALNGYAVYRRFEDKAGGWNYRLVENQLKAEAPPVAPEPQAPPAARQFKRVNDGAVIEAFQWLPDAVPPAALPEWFVQSEFEYKASGELTIRSGGHAVKVAPSDWIYRHGHEIFATTPDALARNFV
jgi:hypothetical protein